MSQIILTREQARILFAAKEAVELRDEDSNLLTMVNPAELRIIQEAKRRARSQQRRIPSATVKEHLDILEEHLLHGCTPDEARKVLQQLQAET